MGVGKVDRNVLAQVGVLSGRKKCTCMGRGWGRVEKNVLVKVGVGLGIFEKSVVGIWVGK